MNLPFRALFSSIACIVALAGAIFGQAAAPSPAQRDAAAMQIVQRAVDALGPRELIEKTHFIVATGTIRESADSAPRTFTWKDALIGGTFEFRKELSGPRGGTVLLSGHGHPRYFKEQNEHGQDLPSHVAAAFMPLHVPAVVLNQILADENYSLRLVEGTSPDQSWHVRTTNSRDDEHAAVVRQDWFFDRSTGLPLRVEYLVPSVNNALDSDTATAIFSDFSLVEGIAVPHRLDISQAGAFIAQVTITTTTFATTISSSDFDVPVEATK